MNNEDCFMLGFDMYKTPEIHELAYNCTLAQQHQLNGLNVINKLYDGTFDTQLFSSFAKFDAEKYQIETYYRSECDQTVNLSKLGRAFSFREGVLTQTHIMKKYPRDMIVRQFNDCGFSLVAEWCSDDNGWGVFTFGL